MTIRTFHVKCSLAHFLRVAFGAAHYESMTACRGVGFELAKNVQCLIPGQTEVEGRVELIPLVPTKYDLA